jgi:hypothetical protein
MKIFNNNNQNGLKIVESNFLMFSMFKACYQKNQLLVMFQQTKKFLYVEEHPIKNLV